MKGQEMDLVAGMGVRMNTAASGMRVGGLAGWLMNAMRALVRGRGRAIRQREMRVVETLTIGAKKQLVLVSCGGERFLVGTGVDSVGTIVRVGADAESAAAGDVR